MIWLVAFAGYAALALVMLWPVVSHLASALPHDPFDPALNTWILWWNAHAVPLTERWWNLPSFWPMPGAIALSEHLLGISVLTTPLEWLGVSPVAAYNVALLLSYPLTALAAHGLAYALTRRHEPAVIAGLVFGFSPYRVAQLPHLQMLWAFGLPLALVAMHCYLETGRMPWLAVFGGAWLLQALANSYYLLFFPALIALWLVWFGRAAPQRALALAGTWAICSLPLAPILWTYSRVHRALNLTRELREIESFSADIASVFTTTPEMIVWHRLSNADYPEGQLFPGALALLLVAAAMAVALARGRGGRRSASAFTLARYLCLALAAVVAAVAISTIWIGPWQFPAGHPIISVSSLEKPLDVAAILVVLALAATAAFRDRWRVQSAFAFYVVAAVVMFALSLGPHPRLAGMPILYRGLYSPLLRLPGFSAIRVPARFGMFAILCLSIAAAFAFARLTAALSLSRQRLAAAVCVIVIGVESWPAVPLTTPAAPIPALLRTDLTGAVMELPLGASWLDAPAQFRAITHGRAVVNGYSGYPPPHYRLLSIALRLNDADVLFGLTEKAPLLVAIDRREQFDRWRGLVERQHGEHVADDGSWSIYRIAQAPDASAPADVKPLPIQAIVPSAGREGVARLMDGDLRTEWNSQRVQAGGEFVVVDLGAERYVAAIRLAQGPFVADYPRHVAVDCAADGGDWTPCWNGSIAGRLLRNLIDDPGTAAASIPIERDRVRRLRLTQTAVDPLNGWSIAELSVLGR